MLAVLAVTIPAYAVPAAAAPDEPVVITRQKQRSVVIMSLDDYKALEETAYLLRSPANAKRLLAATEQLAAGHGTPRKLAE